MNGARISISVVAVAIACTPTRDDVFEPPTIGDTGGGIVSAGDDGEESGSATGALDDDDTVGDGASGAPKLDVAAQGDDGSGCTGQDDICCLMPGEIPPHALLDAFLAAYPPANMPKSVAEIEGWNPMADGHAIAWSNANSGGEIIDPINGGVTDDNIKEGRSLSRQQAETTIPPDATVLDVREDPVQIDIPGGNSDCVGSTGATADGGIGWAWGSILFQTTDLAIHEVVYLYIGFCVGSEDNESFWYSESSAEICAPPG